MFIRSQRLFLRPPFPEDAGAIQVATGLAGMGGARTDAPSPYGLVDPHGGDEAELFLHARHGAAMPQFLVTLPDLADVPVIGGCGLIRAEGQVELYYWIGPQWRGQGFGGEAVAAVLEVANMLGHELVSASHFLDNPASARLLRKAGFRATGEIVPRLSVARGRSAPAARYVGRPHDLAMHSAKVPGEGVLAA